VEPEERSIARQMLGKYVFPTTTNNGAIVERRCFLWVHPEDVRHLKEKLSKSLRTAVEGDGGEKT
jgi:hypothetical protein